MIDLERAREIVADAHDTATITVSARWLKQAIREIGQGRETQHLVLLDLPPAPSR